MPCFTACISACVLLWGLPLSVYTGRKGTEALDRCQLITKSHGGKGVVYLAESSTPHFGGFGWIPPGSPPPADGAVKSVWMPEPQKTIRWLGRCGPHGGVEECLEEKDPFLSLKGCYFCGQLLI